MSFFIRFTLLACLAAFFILFAEHMAQPAGSDSILLHIIGEVRHLVLTLEAKTRP